MERGLVLAAVGQALVAEELVAERGDIVGGSGEEFEVSVAAKDDAVREPREVPFDLATGERSRGNVHDRDRSDELLERQVRHRLVKVRVLHLAEDVRRRVDMRAGVQARVQRGHVELVVVVEALDGVDPRFRVAGIDFRPQQVRRDVDNVHRCLLVPVQKTSVWSLASRTPSARDPKRPSREFLCTIYFVAPVLSVSSAVAAAAFAAVIVSSTMVWTICLRALL